MEMQSLEKVFVNSRLWNSILKRLFLPKVFSPITGEPGPLALEVGCGTGFTSKEILCRFPNITLIAVDYDPTQVKVAHKRLASFGQRVSVRQGDATALDIPSESIDAVFAFNVFHHIQAYERAIKEIQRVLKPAGRLYAMDPSRHLFSLPGIGALFPTEALFTHAEFVQQLLVKGFNVRSFQISWLIFYIAAEKLQT